MLTSLSVLAQLVVFGYHQKRVYTEENVVPTLPTQTGPASESTPMREKHIAQSLSQTFLCSIFSQAFHSSASNKHSGLDGSEISRLNTVSF